MASGPSVSVTDRINQVELADINGDTHLDLVLGSSNAQEVRFVNGAGDGTFDGGSSFFMGREVLVMSLGDVDQDGDTDAVIGRIDSILLLTGDGTGTFTAAPIIETGPLGFYLGLLDLDGDRDLDILAGENLAVWLWDGTTYVEESRYSVDVTRLGVGDFNGDGRVDAVARSGNVGRLVSLLQVPSS